MPVSTWTVLFSRTNWKLLELLIYPSMLFICTHHYFILSYNTILGAQINYKVLGDFIPIIFSQEICIEEPSKIFPWNFNKPNKWKRRKFHWDHGFTFNYIQLYFLAFIITTLGSQVLTKLVINYKLILLKSWKTREVKHVRFLNVTFYIKWSYMLIFQCSLKFIFNF